MADSLSCACPTCDGKGVLGGCGRDDCDHTHTYMFCPDCSNPQPQEGGVGGPVMAGSLCAACGQEGPSGFTVCDECEDGWVYPAPHGFDATDCPAFYDICRCEGTPCPSCRGSGLVATDELREKATDTLLHVLGNITKADGKEAPGE